MKYAEYQKYDTVTDWWEGAGCGKFPIQVPAAISRLQKEHGITFHEAFECLVDDSSDK